ncbi:MAG: pyridoxal 5'-phosphate synthase, partial [Cytophagales bacterium]|nr:pyridoxal 5'-phosphate synthase [Cytophagales bacterium]
MDIAGIRKDYQLQTLDVNDVNQDPIAQFTSWFQAAIEAKVNEPNAMVLSTIKANGRPAARVVLLKGIHGSGLTFFTNYESDKGIELAIHPTAALTFFWPELERQVRLEGKVEKLSEMESLEYFSSRPRGSQLGAHASNQSSRVPSREYLEKAYEDA